MKFSRGDHDVEEPSEMSPIGTLQSGLLKDVNIIFFFVKRNIFSTSYDPYEGWIISSM